MENGKWKMGNGNAKIENDGNIFGFSGRREPNNGPIGELGT